MALIAENAQQRVEQILIVTQRLTELVADETRRIEARAPPLAGAEADEKNRLANAYRLELARIKQDDSLVKGAAPRLLADLAACTKHLRETLAEHELALGAVKIITEGLVQAMAEEVVRQRGGAAGYGAKGELERPGGPSPAIVDRSA